MAHMRAPRVYGGGLGHSMPGWAWFRVLGLGFRV